MKKILRMTLGAVCMAGLVASSSAIQIEYSDRGVGEWTPASEFNSDAGVFEGVKHSVDIWNGVEPEGLYTLGLESATFTKGAGTLVPAALNHPSAFADKVQDAGLVGWLGLDNTSGEFLYMTGKYGNDTQQVFYIGNLLVDNITLPATIAGTTGPALSHVSWLRGTPSVPDGGATALLFGAVMAGVAALRRKLA